MLAFKLKGSIPSLRVKPQILPTFISVRVKYIPKNK